VEEAGLVGPVEHIPCLLTSQASNHFPALCFSPSSPSSPSHLQKPHKLNIQNSILHSPSSIPSAIIMNSIAQLAARSARLNGASALRQANPIARRAFTNGTLRLTASHPRQSNS
jgi:hypothetical protein